MKATAFLATALSSALLMACATPRPSVEEVSRADYGSRPTDEQVVALVSQYMSDKLVDPYSAQYACSPAHKAWITGSSFHNVKFGGRVTYGYVANCNINAKNRMGGYSGARSFLFVIWFRDNRGFAEIVTGPVEIQTVPE